jgi:hypothetical protein
VAFAIIGVAILTISSIFAPISLPFVLLGISALIPVFKQYCYDSLRQLEHNASRGAAFQQEVVNQSDILQDLSNDAIKATYPFVNDDYLAIPGWKSVLSEYIACKGAIENRQTTIDAEMRRVNASIANSITQQNLSHADRVSVMEAHAEKMNYKYRVEEMQILALKVQAAWFLHLIKNPHFTSTAEENIHLYQLNSTWRLLNNTSIIDNQLPPELRDPYLGLADRTILSRRAVCLLSIEDLSFAFSKGGAAIQAAWQAQLDSEGTFTDDLI